MSEIKMQLGSLRSGEADQDTVTRRTVAVAELILKSRDLLPKDAARIELDFHWADGCRVKMEGKA